MELGKHRFKVRLPYDGEPIKDYPAFDFTKLSAINTCPTWGLIRYGHHKTFASNFRAMALEAGEACHQVFAAVRIADLILHGQPFYPDFEVRRLAAQRLNAMFGRERSDEYLQLLTNEDEDDRTNLIRSSLYILETSGFYDDPSDKRRTLDKLSEAIIAYVDRYEFGHSVPLIKKTEHGELFLGVENAFEIIGEYRTVFNETKRIRLTGKIDGVHRFKNSPDDIYVEENKTASRLGDAWELSFEMSHQVTGYIMAARTLFGEDITRAKVRGLALPQPRIHDGAGVNSPTVFRRPHQFDEWADWIVHTLELHDAHFEDPTNAPKYTHSCNRYFRPCSFIPLCAADPSERADYFADMVVDEWSPLHEKAGD